MLTQKEQVHQLTNKKRKKSEGSQASHSNEFVEKVIFAGCSKMHGCKACAIMRNEAYCLVRRKDE